MFKLRPYQEQCNAAIAAGHERSDSVLVELATGTGKTVGFVKYASEFGKDGKLFGEGRSMVICPQIELIGQAAKKLRRETGIQPAIEQAENWSNEQADWSRSPFVVASKQTLTSGSETKRYERFKDVGLVIVDEAHYACTEIYATMLEWFRERGAKILGVTATARRHDKRAMGQVFDECVFQYGITEAIPDGWLVPVRVTCKQLENLDLSGVDSRNSPTYGRDFNQQQLNEKLENLEVIYEIAEAVNHETLGKKTAIYCSSVNEAQAVAERLVDNYGIKADWICSDKKRCTNKRRTEAMKSFTQDPDGVSHLANVGVLTTGWDFPGLECIVNARPTRSLALFTQIFGRLTRPIEHDGRPVVDWVDDTPEARREAIAHSRKPFGRMIDLVDNSLNHKIVTSVDVLGGRMTLKEQQRMKDEIAKKKGPVDFDELAAELAREEERKREERLRRERAKTKAKAKFRDQEVDPYEGRSSSHRNGSQKLLASDKQRKYLWVLGFKDIDQYPNLSLRQASRIIGQLKSGQTMRDVQRTNRLSTSHKTSTKPEVDEPHGADIPDYDEMFSLFR